MPVSVRFAPSPTGRLHLGNVRLALVNWLFARRENGRFYLRLDDTDRERSSDEFAQAIQDDLKWLGLRWDDMFCQSDQAERYQQAIAILKASGRLYPCYETQQELALKRKSLLARGLPPIYDRAALQLSQAERSQLEGTSRPHWRFLLASGTVVWNDLVRGATLFLGQELSDPVLVREDGRVLYSLSSVVDDCQFRISHVIRGADHVTNTAAQIQLWQALGGEVPSFAHLPLMIDQQGLALSKREESLSLRSLREHGIESMAINSFLASVGTSGAIKPVSSLDELAQEFDWSKFSRASTRIDLEALGHLNTRVVRNLPLEEVRDRLSRLDIEEMRAGTAQPEVADSGQFGAGLSEPDREETIEEPKHLQLVDCRDLTRVDDAFWEAVRPNIDRFEDLALWWKIAWAEVKPVITDTGVLKLAAELLPLEPWDDRTWPAWIDQLKQHGPAKGKGLFRPLRLAMTGLEHGPELRKLLPLLGRERTLARLLGRTA